MTLDSGQFEREAVHGEKGLSEVREVLVREEMKKKALAL
jgi:hypothetical protein